MPRFCFLIQFHTFTITYLCMYQPGLHLIATLTSKEFAKLETYEACKQLMNEIVERNSLKNLGEVYHNFTPHGFTAVVCLSESHMSLHTWPEFEKINLDIYLSNHERVNDSIVESIFDALVVFFHAEIVSKTLIKR